MKKINKIILGVVLGLIIIGSTSCGIFYYFRAFKVTTVLMIDINPSIKLSLNYKNDVIKAEGLNEDGKKIINSENFKGDDLEDTIEEITELVVEKGYIKKEETNHILISSEGQDIKNEVVKLFDKELKEKEVECKVIPQEISESAKENAEKYGISENKASFIESLIKEDETLTFEDLKDKTITDINKEIETKEEEKEEGKKEEETPKPEENKKPSNNNSNSNNSNSGGSSNNSGSQNNVSKPSSKPNPSTYVCPDGPENTNNRWCEYHDLLADDYFAMNVNCPYSEKQDSFEVRNKVLEQMGLQSFDDRSGYGYQVSDKRSSYCLAYGYIITTMETRTTLLVDSATGEIIEQSSIPVVYKLSEDDAVDALLNHLNLTRDDLEKYQTWWSTNNEGADYFYRYSVYLTLKTGEHYSASVHADTAEVFSVSKY